MYKIKFKDLILVSNKKRISSNFKTIFFFYGMGNSSDDFDFLIKKLDKKYQLLIPELPGHNNDKFNSKFSLINYANSIVLLILRKNLCNLVFFSHSVGGIIPILIAKQIKQKKKIKKFFNYEGNLTEYDTDTITKKTTSYNMNEFDNKFNKLVGICEQSSQSAIRLWSNSLKKLHQKLFMIYLKIPFYYQKKLFFFNFLEFFLEENYICLALILF